MGERHTHTHDVTAWARAGSCVRLIGSTFVGLFDLRFNRNWSHLVTTNALLALIALAATSPSPIHRPPVSSRSVDVRVDEGRHTLTVTIGPFHVPKSPSMMGAMMMMRRNNDELEGAFTDRKSTRLNSSHITISYAVFCLKKKNNTSKPS